MDLNLNFTNLPPANICQTFNLLAHSNHIDLTKVACFTITTDKAQLEKLPFGLLTQGHNYTDTDYFKEDGTVNEEAFYPETMSLDYGVQLRMNILMFFKLATDSLYKPDIADLYICYDNVYVNTATSFLAGYYILKGVDENEAVAQTAIKYPNCYFDYPSICFLDMILGCEERLIEAVETYEVTDIAVTKDGQVAERHH